MSRSSGTRKAGLFEFTIKDFENCDADWVLVTDYEPDGVQSLNKCDILIGK